MRCNKAELKNVHVLLVCDVMLDLLIVVYVQFVIMLIEFQKVLSRIQWMWALYIFIAVDIYINILYRNMCVLYRNVYTVQVCMSTSVVVVHCVE